MAAPPPGGGRWGDASCSEKLHQLVRFPPAELIAILAPLLDQLMERNEALPLLELTSFHAQSRPPLSIHSYLHRFLQYAPMANECYILMLIYLDRISQTNSAFCITALNAHRLIVTGLVLAAKFSQDRYYTNTHYARVGGLPGRELKALELDFLARICYTLWAEPEIIEAYWTQLLQHAQRNSLLSEKAKLSLQGLNVDDKPAGPASHSLPVVHDRASARAAHSDGQYAQKAPHAPRPALAAGHGVEPWPKRPRFDEGIVSTGWQSDARASFEDMAYTDENMRYELLRRQQERLRQIQPQPSARMSMDATLEPSGAPGLQTTHFSASSGAGRQQAVQAVHRPPPSPARMPPNSRPATDFSPEQSVPMKRPSVSAPYPHAVQAAAGAYSVSPHVDIPGQSATQPQTSAQGPGSHPSQSSVSPTDARHGSLSSLSDSSTDRPPAHSAGFRHPHRQQSVSKSPHFVAVRSPLALLPKPGAWAPPLSLQGQTGPAGSWGQSTSPAYPNPWQGTEGHDASNPQLQTRSSRIDPLIADDGRDTLSPRISPSRTAMGAHSSTSPCGVSPVHSATHSPVIIGSV